MPYPISKMYMSGEHLIALKARAIAMNVFLAKARNTYSPRDVGDGAIRKIRPRNDLKAVNGDLPHHTLVSMGLMIRSSS